MRIGKNREKTQGLGAARGRPTFNLAKRGLAIFVTLVITAMLIAYVYVMGQKATETVEVIKLAQNVYKNQMITASMLMPYEMLKGEYEKYARVNTNGVRQRRLFRVEEASEVVGLYAAYPLKAETYLETRDLIASRVDNSDSVLYSFPGKEIIPFEMGGSEMNAFKNFLQPGDRLNIEGIYSQEEFVVETDDTGREIRSKIPVYRTEPVFQDIMIADLLNGDGDSILDIYADYNDRTAREQAQLDSSEDFQERVAPRSLLVALTPEEKERYYYFLSKEDIQFKASMPQRVND
jgi:hypothetical protein